MPAIDMPEWRRLDGVGGELLVKREMVYAMQAVAGGSAPVTQVWMRGEAQPFEVRGSIGEVARTLGFSVI